MYYKKNNSKTNRLRESVKNHFKELKIDAKSWKDYTFRDYIFGNYSKKFLTSTFIPTFLFIFLGGLFAAYMLFPEQYSVLTHSISKLGNYLINRTGWWGFSLSLLVGCFSLLSFSYYIYQRIAHISPPKLAKLFLRLYQVTCVGMFLIAFIADAEVNFFNSTFQLKIIHWPIAAILFSCFIFGSTTLLVILFRDNNLRKGGTKFVDIKKIIPSLIIFGIAVVGSAVTQPWAFIGSLLGSKIVEILAFSTSMWEWILFVGFISFFSGIAIAIPDTE
ncbi:MAG: hypothetical protein JW776_15940 [Candidatus Lokiarchaeota archaeon]|nr:hypothetical protein [Candidatus Lokiarchaeota archaeon]